MNDITFGVKLTKHAVVKAIALHPCPEFELIGGYSNEVAGEIVARKGVHAAPARLGVDLIKLILDDRGSLSTTRASALLRPD